MKKTFLFVFVIFSLSIGSAFAHQPRIPEGDRIIVTDPEISKAYYSRLSGEPHIYTIASDTEFALYVNILVPDIPGQKRDVSAAVIKNGDTENPIIVLNGINFEWKKFFEPFGYDSYLMGPEYKTKAPPGTYEIRVWSSNNDSKYALAIGETENFDAEESANALRLIPKIKRDFFDKSPADFIFSVFGYGYVLGIFLLAFVFGFISRAVLKKIAKKSTRGLSKNINFADRFLRVFLGVALFWIAITTTWNPFVLFLSGFCFFEALAGWCGLYAAIGKNSCPV